MEYIWNDILVDDGIVAIVLRLLVLKVGSFPTSFSKLLAFLE